MAHGPQAFNPGCCFAIKHSDTCKQLKEGTLLITAAIATIAVIGGVLGVLALNGVNLGALNSLTTMIGEKYIYIGLVAGTGLLLIDTVLIAALTRSYYNKQYTQRELDSLNLGEWINQENVLAKLEPGQYWRFPADAKQPVRATERSQGRPAVWGFVTRDHEGNVGVYAFKTQGDSFSQIMKLGYQNGEVKFADSSKYTSGYITTQVEVDVARGIQDWQATPLGHGEYQEHTFQMSDGTNVYGLRVNKDGQTDTRFYKTADARRAHQANRLKHEDVVSAIQDEQDKVAYLPQTNFWVLENAVSVNDFDIEMHELFVVFSKAAGADVMSYDYFRSAEDAAAFAARLTRHGYTDAKATWNDPARFPADWVEAHCERDALTGIRLKAQQFAVVDFEADTDEQEDVYALKFKVAGGERSHYRYFKSEDVREQYIDERLGAYTDAPGLEAAVAGRHGIIATNGLEGVLRTPNQDCWTDQVVLHGKTYYLLIGLTESGLSKKIFDTAGQRVDWLGRHENWQPVNGRYLAGGRFQPEWVAGQIDDLRPATNWAPLLEDNQYTYGTLQTRDGETNVYWLAVKGEEDAEMHYFVTNEARGQYIQRNARNALDLNDRAHVANQMKEAKLIELALTAEGDCWGESRVRVGAHRLNILYTRTDRGVEISYPADLDEAKRGLNDVKANMERTNEYPPALGARLAQSMNVSIRNYEPFILKGEYCAWSEPRAGTGSEVYVHVYPVQIRAETGELTTRFFRTTDAKNVAVDGMPNGYVRHRDETRLAARMSVGVNQASGVDAVAHCVVFPHEDAGKTHIVTVSADGRDVTSEYVNLDATDARVGEIGLANPRVAYARLEQFTESEIAYLDANDANWHITTYLGGARDGTGRLNVNQHKTVDNATQGYYLLLWVNGEGRADCAYFKTGEARGEYIAAHLGESEAQ